MRILERLPSLPRHFALALMLFDRPSIRQAVAAYLGMPELVRVYDTVAQPRLTPQDRAFLVRFGQQHPGYQALLAESLRLYEYHLYSNYSCSPNWFFKDFHYFAKGKGANLLWLLTSNVDLLPALAGMRTRGELIGRRDASAVGLAYEDLLELCYAVILLHGILTDDSRLGYWTDLPENSIETIASDLLKGRKRAHETARCL